jgi:hypothetical protein
MRGLRVISVCLLLGGCISLLKGSQFGGWAIGSAILFAAAAFFPWERFNAERRRF